MSSEITHEELGIRLADALSIATRLIEALSGSYRFNKSVVNTLFSLESSLSNLKSSMTTIYNATANKVETDRLGNPYYPIAGEQYVRSEINIKLSGREQISGKSQLSSEDIDAAILHLSGIEESLEIGQKFIADFLDNIVVQADFNRAFTCCHQAKVLLSTIKPTKID